MGQDKEPHQQRACDAAEGVEGRHPSHAGRSQSRVVQDQTVGQGKTGAGQNGGWQHEQEKRQYAFAQAQPQAGRQKHQQGDRQGSSQLENSEQQGQGSPLQATAFFQPADQQAAQHDARQHHRQGDGVGGHTVPDDQGKETRPEDFGTDNHQSGGEEERGHHKSGAGRSHPGFVRLCLLSRLRDRRQGFKTQRQGRDRQQDIYPGCHSNRSRNTDLWDEQKTRRQRAQCRAQGVDAIEQAQIAHDATGISHKLPAKQRQRAAHDKGRRQQDQCHQKHPHDGQLPAGSEPLQAIAINADRHGAPVGHPVKAIDPGESPQRKQRQHRQPQLQQGVQPDGPRHPLPPASKQPAAQGQTAKEDGQNRAESPGGGAKDQGGATDPGHFVDQSGKSRQEETEDRECVFHGHHDNTSGGFLTWS